MQEKTKEPEIRFAGFTGAWKQRKLSDGMTEYTDRVFIEDDQIYKQVTVKNTGEISLRGSQPGRNIGRKRQARVNLRDYPMTLIFTRQTVEQGGIGFAKNDVDGCIVTENMPTIAVDGKKFNQDFLVAFFKTYGFRKDVILSNIEGGTAQIAIHEDDILDSSSTFPSLKEQIKIGNFFRTLSQQITLHQRKYEKLLNIKKSMLEKMFPKEGEVVPEIRFKGFTGAWEQRKLSDIAERITRKNTHLESTLPLTISSSYGLIDQYAYFNNRVASRNTRNYYLIKNGEFAYNKSYSDGFPFGSVKRLDRYAMGVLSTLYIIFSIDYRKVNSDFLVSYYDTKNWHHQVALRAAEGARNHGLLNISADDFFETELKIPMDLDEQKKIGSFFVQLNSFITLHQRKLEMLKNVKQAFLEKMFV